MPRGRDQPQDRYPWRYGRKEVDRTGRERVYAPITEQHDTGTISERFLSEDERIVIAEMLRAGRSLRAIAKQLHRAPSTISREVRRNRDPRTGRYPSLHASGARPCGGRAPKQGKIGRDPELKELVQDHLDRRWSPEQISQDLRPRLPRRAGPAPSARDHLPGDLPAAPRRTGTAA